MQYPWWARSLYVYMHMNMCLYIYLSIAKETLSLHERKYTLPDEQSITICFQATLLYEYLHNYYIRLNPKKQEFTCQTQNIAGILHVLLNCSQRFNQFTRQ